MKGKEAFLFTVLLVACLDLCLLYNLTDLDIWARLAVGKLIFELGHVSPHDLFSYTPQKPLFIDHEWGSSVVFYSLANGFGQKGLILLRALLFFGTVLFAHLSVRERIENPNSLLLHLLLTFSLVFGFMVTIRSHTFTYFFFALWLFLLERARKGKNRGLVLIPLTMIPWANLHGGFVSGIGLVLIYGTAEFLHRRPWKRFAFLILLCLAVTLLNPYGLDYWIYLLKALTMHRPNILEWRAFRLFEPVKIYWAYKILLFLAVSLFVINRVKRADLDWVDVLLLLITGYLGIKHIRHITFFCIACFPFVYTSLRHWKEEMKGNRILGHGGLGSLQDSRIGKVGGGALHGILLAVVILLAFSVPMRVGLPAKFPMGAVAFIKENRLGGNLLTQFNWGSYAIWELFPLCRVSIDGRYEEVYPDSTYEDIERFTNGEEGWEDALKKYPNDLILIRKNSPVFLKLRDRHEWRIVYQDDISALYLPSNTPAREWLFPDVREKEEKDPFSTVGKGTYVTGRG